MAWHSSSAPLHDRSPTDLHAPSGTQHMAGPSTSTIPVQPSTARPTAMHPLFSMRAAAAPSHHPQVPGPSAGPPRAAAKRKEMPQSGHPPVRTPKFKQTNHSNRIVPIGTFAQPVRTAAEIRKFMEMSAQHPAGTKVSWDDMAAKWNADVATQLMLLPKDGIAVFPALTFKRPQHLKKYNAAVAERIDNEISRMSMSVQPKLARATLQSFADAAGPPAATAAGAIQMQAIDRTGSTSDDIGWSGGASIGTIGTMPYMPTAMGTAGPSSTAAVAVQLVQKKGVGKGGKGGTKSCKLCEHILGYKVPIAGHRTSCTYQQLLEQAKKDGAHGNMQDSPAFRELDAKLQNGAMPTSLDKMYGSKLYSKPK